MTRLLVTLAAVAALVTAAGAAAATGTGVELTPIARLPFPERGYVVDLPPSTSIDVEAVVVRENGRPVESFALTPVGTSGIRYGAILAVDSSESMAGDAIEAATTAARSFVDHRGPNEWIGLVTFDGSVTVDVRPTDRPGPLLEALAAPPALAYGTRLFDGVERALAVLRASQIAAGSVVVLTDGADVGSVAALEDVAARAKAQHVRIFPIGLRSGAFDPAPLRRLARETGGRYAETNDAGELDTIYRALSRRLADEYLLQYRSTAAPQSRVDVDVEIAGVGTVAHEYTAPTPSALAPYHRSAASRFLLSPYSLLVLSLAGALLVALLVATVVDRGRSHLVERVGAFVDGIGPTNATGRPRRVARMTAAGTERARGLLAKLDLQLDIADIQLSARRVAAWTLVATTVAVVVFAVVAPVSALGALGTPLVVRGLIKRRVAKVRAAFADQLPPTLQVLASALRAGHSFGGALAMSADNAHEPMQRELKRAITDEQLGVPMDEAIRRVADRMASRDLVQVALLAELQRTTGGNAAEVLDVVVGTVRERADIRRLVRTLTAQGRMARWILSGLPVVVGFFGYLMQPEVTRTFLASTGGQVALVLAGLLVFSGSLMIQRIVDIEV